MSEAYSRPRALPGAGPLKLPRASSVGNAIAAINAGFEQIERADTANVKRGRETAFASILLSADDGTTWRLKAVPNGDGTASLVLRLVPR